MGTSLYHILKHILVRPQTWEKYCIYAILHTEIWMKYDIDFNWNNQMLLKVPVLIHSDTRQLFLNIEIFLPEVELYL